MLALQSECDAFGLVPPSTPLAQGIPSVAAPGSAST